MSEQTAAPIDRPPSRRWDDWLTGLFIDSLEINESAAAFGMVACLALLSMALVADLAFGVALVYALPIVLSVWLFGRWVGVSAGVFAIIASVTVAFAGNGEINALPVVVPALVLITAASVAGAEWARRSEHLVMLLKQSDLRHAQMLETMTKVGQELVANKRWEVIAEHIMASLVRDLELDVAWMFERDRTGAEAGLRLLASAGGRPPVEVAEVGMGTLGLAVNGGRTIDAGSRSELMAKQPSLQPTDLEEGLEAILALPVLVKGGTTGAVLLGCRRAREWSVEEVGIAATLVNQLGLAMENASAYRSTIDALGRMEEINQLKSDLLQTVSHELRTPMTVIAGYMDMMRDGSLGAVPDAWAKPLEQVMAKVDELNRLVQMSLEASRAEGPLRVNLHDIDIASAVAVAVEAQAGEAATAGHSLRLEAARNPVMALCDRDKMLVVVRNLIENAIKYSPAKSVVDIGLAADPDIVRVWVADRGPGIATADRARIFEQFYRGEGPMTRNVTGTGLGLFIVKQLVQVQGGTITLEDRPGGGSVFTFAMPRRPELMPETGQVVRMKTVERPLRSAR